jgi:phage terminase small subunit
MPALRNPRHERFAREYHKNGVASRAYERAGYRAANRNVLDSKASRLVRSGKMKARLAELQNMTAKRHEITVDTLLADLETDRALAHCEGQGSAAVQATMAKARLLGLIVDRKETGKPGEFEGLKTVDDVIAAVRTEFGDKVADALAQELAAHETVAETPRTKRAAKAPTNSGSGSLQ